MKDNIITVFGSFVVDLVGLAPHLPKPAETVKGSLFKKGPGGKGFNQAVAAHKAGGAVRMVTKLGKDDFGKIALGIMDDLGMSKEFLIFSDDVNTGAALIMVDEQSGQNKIVVVPGACETISDDEVESFKSVLEASDFLLLQLETNLSSVVGMIELANKTNCRVILNPAPAQRLDEDIFSKVSMVTPNEVEAESITGVHVEDEQSAMEAGRWFKSHGVDDVIITMGEKGVFVLDKNNDAKFVPAYKVKAVDTTGAGDAFNGGLVTALAEGKGIFEAVDFANAVAALSVQKLGTAMSMPTRNEVDDFIKEMSV